MCYVAPYYAYSVYSVLHPHWAVHTYYARVYAITLHLIASMFQEVCYTLFNRCFTIYYVSVTPFSVPSYALHYAMSGLVNYALSMALHYAMPLCHEYNTKT